MKTLLLIEDNGFVRELIGKTFLNQYQIVLAKSGQEAFEQFKLIKPDIILSDLYIPDVDGITILETIREKKFNTPFIIITAFPNKFHIKRAIQLGATAFLLKQEGFFTELEFIINGLENIKNCFLGNGTSALMDETTLTKREIEVARLITDGKTSEAIAETLFISINTVNNHRKAIKRKLQYGNLAQLSVKINSLFAI